jgi:flavodoxin
MNIHILVHSKTGNTRKFADAIQGAMTGLGHQVRITQLETLEPVGGTKPGDKNNITITNLPDLDDAQIVFLGTPVWAFRSAPVILAAIRQCGSLNGKKVVPFATMGFAIKCLGGNGTLKQIGLEAANKGARVLPGAVISAGKSRFEREMHDAVAKFTAIVNL